MLTVLACIFVFGILVTVHEFGHFITAKLTGMKVEEFSIGFGPNIYQQQEGETLYSLRMLPLGGYNKIAGMDPEDPEDLERGFNSKPVASRMLVILAGSLMNFILPVLIFFGIFLAYGMEVPQNTPVLGQIVEGYPAAQSGLKEGDKVLSINGQPVSQWTDIRTRLADAGTKPVPFEIQRDKEMLTVTVTPVLNPETGKPFIGVVSSLKRVQLTPWQAAVSSVTATKNIIKNMYASLYHMITGKTKAELSGPVGVAKMAGQVAHKGFDMLLQFTAMLSLNLAIINLLPLPALDGGHFLIKKEAVDNIAHKDFKSCRRTDSAPGKDTGGNGSLETFQSASASCKSRSDSADQRSSGVFFRFIHRKIIDGYAAHGIPLGEDPDHSVLGHGCSCDRIHVDGSCKDSSVLMICMIPSDLRTSGSGEERNLRICAY